MKEGKCSKCNVMSHINNFTEKYKVSSKDREILDDIVVWNSNLFFDNESKKREIISIKDELRDVYKKINKMHEY
jgi:hypothetical protein